MDLYKIFIAGKPIWLTTRAGVEATGVKPAKYTFIVPYNGKIKMFKQYSDLLQKNRDVEAVVIFSENLEKLWSDFQSIFKVIEAAGGLVVNPKGETLVFFRRGSWDLPKGKIDEGETPEQAAVREVQEETGVKNIELGAFICHTYHTYEHKEKRVLKKTWWYHMKTTDFELIPQREEDIEEIAWVDLPTWLEKKPVMYPNIREIFQI